MRQVFSIDFENDEIDAIRNFIKFHSKRLKCTESEVFKRLAVEFEESLKVVDYHEEKAKAGQASETPVPKGLPLPTRGMVRNERNSRVKAGKPGRQAKKSRA